MFNLFKKKSFGNVPKEMQEILRVAFPQGEKQMEKETKRLYEFCKGQLTLEQSKGLLIWTKSYALLNKRTFDEVCEGIHRHEKGRLDLELCGSVYEFILKMHLLSENS